MSSQLTQQQKKSRKAFSKTMKAQIKRRPHTEPINGIQYTYGLLQKKSQSSLFNNQRFLIIKGHQTFGYVSKLSQDVLLPFLQQSAIPKCKIQIPLDKIDINNDKQILIVQFFDQKSKTKQKQKQKIKWQFKCGSKAKAIQWRQKLQGAKNQKLLSLQNIAVPVILEDQNQNNQESQFQQKKKIEIVNYNSKQNINNTQTSGNENLFINFSQKNNTNTNIMIKEQDKFGQQRSSNQKKQKYQSKKDENINPSQQNERSPKLQQFNFFDSLLSSSPNKSPLQSSKLNVQTSQKQKNFNSLMGLIKPQTQSRLVEDSYQFNNQDPASRLLKDEFLKRKKQQSKLKNQLQQQNSNFLSSIINQVSDTKFQLQKLKKQWSYEFAKGNNQYEIIQSFKIYVEIITMKIIDQLALQAKKRFYKPIKESSESVKYEIDGVSIEYFFSQLNEVSSFQGKGSIISNNKIKQAYQQLKNYDYILQLTNNKGRIRVPLVMCVEYKGFTGIAKTMIPESQSYQNMQSLQKQLDLLQAESRIHNSVFQDGQNGRIIPLQSKIFEKIARAQNNYSQNSKKFDICYIEGLKHYLPQDFYRNSQENKNNYSLSNSNNFLRKELIQDEQYSETVFHGENMMNVVNKLKIPQYLKDSVDLLTEVSKTISDRVNALVIALENLDETVTNSKDLSNLMHGYGLNIRYLGLLLQRSKQNWLKGIIISEISARCAKYFLKFDLQDCIMNLNESKLQNIKRYQVKQVISFLNKILGNSQQSSLFWHQLSRQSQEHFNCYIDKNLINFGFFIQSLQAQCRIKLVNVFENKEKFFKVPQPLSIDNFLNFQVKSKTYDLSFTDLYGNVNQYIKEPTQQSYQQLSILLNISRKGFLPSHFRLNDFEQKVLLFLINWLPPSQGKQIYYPEQIRLGQILPTKTLYQIKLTQIKWLLKDKQQQKAQKVRDFIIQHVNKWLGEYHPILSQLYDLFSTYYLLHKFEQKKAITYCKTSVKNIEKLLSPQHIKLADHYYMMAQIYVNYQKKTEALNSLKRAKQILEQRQGQQTQAYGLINLRMAQLFLANNQSKQALKYGMNSYSRIIQSINLQKFIDCVQLIGRCYQVDDMWADYIRFSYQIINNLTQLNQIIQNPQYLERILKVIVLPHFYQLSKNPQSSRQLLSILLSFTSFHNLTPSIQNSSYEYIKSLFYNNENQNKKKSVNASFPTEFLQILNSQLQQLLEEIQSSGLMTRWKGFQNVINNKSLMNKVNTVNEKGFQFLAILESLSIFLGDGWIEGVLRQA